MARRAQYSTTPIQFIMVLSSDSRTGATGKTVTVQLAKGSAAYANAAGSVVEIGNGRYALIPTSTDTNTVGDLGLKATALGCDVTDNTHEIITNAQAAAEAIVTGLPVVPSVSRLVTEAYRRMGHPNPSVADLLRAEDEWFEEVKREIADKKSWRGLEETTTVSTVVGQQLYTIPATYARITAIRLTWGTTYEREIDGPNEGMRRLALVQGMPSQWEEYEGEFLLYPVPDRADYSLAIRGIVDLSLVDKSDARLVKLQREWRTPLLYGLMQKIAEDDADWTAAQYHKQLKGEAILDRKIADSRNRRRGTGAGFRGPGGLPRRWGSRWGMP
jgi:hypothetical protein